MQTKMKLSGGGWGGLRNKAGRKRVNSKGVSHSTREEVTARTPVHVNFKYRISVRNKDTLKLLRKAIQNARRHGLKILHYSFQHYHIRLILEAENNSVLTKGMRSLTITFAKGLQKGSVQIERYHLHVLKTVREARHALHYVLFNQQKHEKGTYSEINEYSSVLFMEEGLKLIKNFAREKGMTLKITKENNWIPDSESSFIMKRATI